MHSLVNVPTAKSGLEIQGYVAEQTVYIICAERGATFRDGRSVAMTDVFIGDHLLHDPNALREMIARDLATAIRLARDAGYAQAKAELRGWLEIASR